LAWAILATFWQPCIARSAQPADKEATGLTLVASIDNQHVTVGEPVTLTVRLENRSDKPIFANFRRRQDRAVRVDGREEWPVRIGGLRDVAVMGHRALPVPPAARERQGDDAVGAKRRYVDVRTLTFDEPGLYRIVSTWRSEDVLKGRDPDVFVGSVRSNTVEVNVAPLEGEALLARLDRCKVNIRLEKIGLESAVRIAAGVDGTYEVEVDRKGLAAAGIKPDAPVTVELNDVGTRDALKQLFTAAGARDAEPVIKSRGSTIIVSVVAAKPAGKQDN
jgi:hypothetical protein